jgi:hypothetical protein
MASLISLTMYKLRNHRPRGSLDLILKEKSSQFSELRKVI